MKEIPILFSTPMVQAILEGRKTMTRRILKNPLPIGVRWWQVYARELIYRIIDSKHVSTHCKCKYGQPGDVLWVRETFAVSVGEFEPYDTLSYKADSFHRDIKRDGIEYAEGILCEEGWHDETYAKETTKWKSPRFMPKAVARIWLQVEEIRVERLQDITEEDAIAEGVTCYEAETDWLTAKYGFEILWYKINGEESWKANPWVWVVKFKTLSTTGKPSF